MATRNMGINSTKDLKQLFFGRQENTDTMDEVATHEDEVTPAEESAITEMEKPQPQGMRKMFSDYQDDTEASIFPAKTDEIDTDIPSFLHNKKDKSNPIEEEADIPVLKVEEEKTAKAGTVEVPVALFSDLETVSDVFTLNIISNERVEEITFVGTKQSLLDTVRATEEKCLLTMPVYAYGVTREVLEQSEDYEILAVDGIEFLSNKKRITNKQHLENLVHKIEEQLAIGKEYQSKLCTKYIVSVEEKHYKIPALLVNTYEYNILRKTFEGVANITLEDSSHGVYLVVRGCV